MERVLELLASQNLGMSETDMIPITEGASGAHVWSIDDRFIVKYAYLPSLDAGIRRQFRNELAFYRRCGNGIEFVPNVIYSHGSDEEILLVLQQYRPIPIGEWDAGLQKRAMETCARLNALETSSFQGILENEPDAEPDAEELPLSESYANWLRLSDRFPNKLDAKLLEEMERHFEAVGQYERTLAIPQTMRHGDCHPSNFLLDGDSLMLCDWQGVGIGSGIGDVAFFISRGMDMGLAIDRHRLIAEYAGALRKCAGIDVPIDMLLRSMAASEFMVAFRFWAEYLQEAEEARVMGIYRAMEENYNLLASEV